MRMDGRRLSRMYDVCAFESTFVCVLSPLLEFQARSASMWFQKAGVTGKRLTNRQLFSPWQSHLHIKMAVGQNARRSMSQLFDFFGLPSPKPDEPGWTSGTHWLLPNKHHGFWTSTPDPQLALSGTAHGAGFIEKLLTRGPRFRRIATSKDLIVYTLLIKHKMGMNHGHTSSHISFFPWETRGTIWISRSQLDQVLQIATRVSPLEEFPRVFAPEKSCCAHSLHFVALKSTDFHQRKPTHAKSVGTSTPMIYIKLWDHGDFQVCELVGDPSWLECP